MTDLLSKDEDDVAGPQDASLSEEGRWTVAKQAAQLVLDSEAGHAGRLDIVARLIALLWWHDDEQGLGREDEHSYESEPIDLRDDITDPISNRVDAIVERWQAAAVAEEKARELVKRADAERAALPAKRRKGR
jgi:hypothetical protein